MGSISFDLIVETPSFVRGQHSVALPQEIYVFKSEARNPKFETNPNDQNPNVPNYKGMGYGDRDFCFCHWGIRYLNIVSDFDIRISDFHKAPTANHAHLA